MKEIYSPMEEVLIKSALLAQSLETKKKTTELLELDEMLLQMEAKQGLMDGVELGEWLL